MSYSVWCAGELLAEHDDMVEALRVCRREARARKKACEVRGERGVVLGACIPDSLSAAEAMRQARRTNHSVMTGPVERGDDQCRAGDHDWIAFDRATPRAFQCRICHAWAEERGGKVTRQRCSACERWAVRRIAGHGRNPRWVCDRHER